MHNCYRAEFFFPNSMHSHWLLQGHMTSNNKTFSHQSLWAGNSAKSMTSEGNSAVLPANVDCRPPLHIFLFVLFNKSLSDWSFGKQLIILFPLHFNVSLARDQSLSVYCNTSYSCWLIIKQPLYSLRFNPLTPRSAKPMDYFTCWLGAFQESMG